MKPKIEYWMLNLIIGALQKEYDDKILSATKNLSNTAEIDQYVKDLQDNPMTEVGKLKATLDASINWRENWSNDVMVFMGHEDMDAGWDCTPSPDGKCHYFSTEVAGKFFVNLNNGNKHCLNDNPNLTEYTMMDHKNENEDWCIFCGNPEERK